MKKSEKNKPIENHETAAWANAKVRKKQSRVNLPDQSGCINSKIHVDQNEK